MMLVSSLSDHICVCDPTLLQHLGDRGLIIRVVHQSESLVLAELQTGVHDLDAVLNDMGVTRTPRYLDRFYLCFSSGDGHQRLLDAFFALIGYEYDSLVDVHRNQHNIRLLFELIEHEIGDIQGKTLVDFGCATGLSIEIARSHGTVLLGCDSCPTMRSIAASRGLRVLAPSEFTELPMGSVDAVLASYVFHLIPDFSSFENVWGRVRVGGVLAANLHKNQGYDPLSGAMRKRNATEISPAPAGGERHGRYLVYRKVTN